MLWCRDPAHRLITFWLAFGGNRSKSNQMLWCRLRIAKARLRITKARLRITKGRLRIHKGPFRNHKGRLRIQKGRLRIENSKISGLITFWLAFGGNRSKSNHKCSDVRTRLPEIHLFSFLFSFLFSSLLWWQDPTHRLITFWLAFGGNRSKSNQMLWCRDPAHRLITFWLAFGGNRSKSNQMVWPGSPFDYFLACFWRKSLKK